jgi:hypothetical protein
MEKNRIRSNVRCPSCNGPLYPRLLVCDDCNLKVEGDFALNEFGLLTPDELHFLRVFIHCEGRIRDMEAALGVSYPTVKTHLSSIKDKLNLAEPGFTHDSRATESTKAGRSEHDEELPAEEILDRLESGDISYKDALKLLKAKKKGDGHGDRRVR